jgi:hypothetical protein
MKKLMMILALVVAMAVMPVSAATLTFSDVAPGAWYYGTVSRLTELGSIAGYPDGTFEPDGTITTAEFVKMLAFATAGPAYANADEHWAAGVMLKARELQLIQGDEFAAETWDTPILRQQMARLLARTLEYVMQEEPVQDAMLAVVNSITDWDVTCESCKPYVAQVYAKGLIAGMPDGSFAGTQTATRAEAATMMVRLLDPSQRALNLTIN